jgi:putative protein kinase ArgK-like GTPase of G3E family
MPVKPQSWKKLSSQRREQNFVGRADRIREFEQNFAGEEPNYMIFSITGEGGVGKSTLLKRFAEICPREVQLQRGHL